MSLPPAIFPEQLREYLAARECVAFVGAGFSMPCGMPSWIHLLQNLLREAAKSITSSDEDTLLHDSQEALAARLLPTAAAGVRTLLSKEQLRRSLTEAFDSGKLTRLAKEQRDRMLERVENLVLGPWAGIITTNFDTLIETGFDRFPELSRTFRCYGSQSSLGNVLCLPIGAGGFFVKLHGDTWADTQVLSTADYVQTWLTSRRIRHFLTAVMLRYRIVFVGCSIEDAVLQLRLALWSDFGQALPKAYALVPDTSANRLRRRELREEAGLESLLYPVGNVGDGHETVDEFLREARRCADFRRVDPQLGSLATLQSRPLDERVEAIGSINRHLLAILNRQPEGRLKYSYIFDPFFEQVPQADSRHVLSTVSEAERLYRILFLVALGIVVETSKDGCHYFSLPEELTAYLASVPSPEFRST